MTNKEKTVENVEAIHNENDIADEKAGEELMEKILNAIKTPETPQVDPTLNKEAEYKETIARQQADFDNFRKRMEKEKQENLINANANLISELLSVLDHFELALKHNKDKGVTLIYEELTKILKENGLKVIDTKVPFNPRFHEAVLKVDGKKDGEILEEIQKGYLLNDKLLRASKVKISKTPEKK